MGKRRSGEDAVGANKAELSKAEREKGEAKAEQSVNGGASTMEADSLCVCVVEPTVVFCATSAHKNSKILTF